MEEFHLQPVASINLTNLVDVCLTLLIIFMITAPMLRSGVEVELPQVAAAVPADKGLTITLTARQEIIIQDQKVLVQSLPQVMQNFLLQKPGQAVFLKADRSVPYGFVVEVIGKLKEQGVNNLGLVTETPSANGKNGKGKLK
jgi:biopolymer transport protein TolR